MPCPLQQQTERKCPDFGQQQLDRSSANLAASKQLHPGVTQHLKALSWSSSAQAWLLLALLSSLVGESTTASSGTCPVSIEYAVSLGQGGDNSAVPVFVGSLGITNNANLTVQSWRLGWNFTDGENLAQAADYFPNTSYPLPGSFNATQVQIQSTALQANDAQQAVLDAWFGPQQEQTLQFLGHKATVDPNPDNPYKVAPVTGMMFNNLICSSWGSANSSHNSTGGLSPANQPQYTAVINSTIAPTDSLFLEYTPIDYVNIPVGTPPFTQFLVRLTNIGNDSIALDDVTFDYWFNGPAEADQQFTTDLFRTICGDSTIGCSIITHSIVSAFQEALGARFKLTIGFNSPGTVLLPTLGGSGDLPALTPAGSPASAPGPAGPLQLPEMEVLFEIQSRQFLVPMNSSLDYSYFDAPRNGLPSNQTGYDIIPRTAVPNPKVAAYINNTIVWGSEPLLVLNGAPAAAPGPADAEAVTNGINCQGQGNAQVCGLSVTYCCYGDGPLSAVIPTIWPPNVTSQGPPEMSSPEVAPPAEAPGPEPANPAVGMSSPGAAPGQSVSGLSAASPAPGLNGTALGLNGTAPAPAPALSPAAALGPSAQLLNQTTVPSNQSTATIEAGAPSVAITPTQANVSASPPASLPSQTASLTSPPSLPAATLTAQSPAATALLPNDTISLPVIPSLTPPASPTAPSAPVHQALPSPSPTPSPIASLGSLAVPAANISSDASAAEIASTNALAPLLSPANSPEAAPNSPSEAAANSPSPAAGSPAAGSLPSNTSTYSEGGAGKPKLSAGPIAGIAVGMAALAGVLAAASFFIWRRRRAHSRRLASSQPVADPEKAPGMTPTKPKEGTQPVTNRWQGADKALTLPLRKDGSGLTATTGDSEQALLGYNPLFGEHLQRQRSQEVAVPTHTNGNLPLRVNSRHQRRANNPLEDERWPFTPMAAELAGGRAMADGSHFLPFNNRTESNRLAFDALSRQGSAQLVRQRSDLSQRQGSDLSRRELLRPASGLLGQGQGLIRQESGQLRSGLTQPWQEAWEPALAVDESASGESVILHGPHSLLERHRQGLSTQQLQAGLLGGRAASMPALQNAFWDADDDFDSAILDSNASQPPGYRPEQTWNCRISNRVSGTQLPAAMQRYRHLQRPSHRRANSAELPPLSILPPPVFPNSAPSPDIDMNVDYEAEIAPALQQCLGSGGFGSVYAAVWRGKNVAVKRLSPSIGNDSAQYRALVREVKLCSAFNSDRLVRVYGASLKETASVCLIMERVIGGNLHQRIKDATRPRISYLEILQLGRDLAEGLAYLHPLVIHRDLKPSNVLLDEHGRAKIADFGISRVKDPSKTCLSTCNDDGTPMYMAPEQFNGTRMDEKVDVYSLGCILNECMTRRQPWPLSSHPFQIIVKVAIQKERPRMDAECPDSLRRLIQKCWHQDPLKRPSCAEIVRLFDILIQQGLRNQSVR